MPDLPTTVRRIDTRLDVLVNIDGIDPHTAARMCWGDLSGDDPGPAPANPAELAAWGRAWVRHRARELFGDVEWGAS